jgi:pseudaminic acid synthase
MIEINGRKIGEGTPAYIIAEMSANHGKDEAKAIEIIHAMKESGADCVKIQTYTPDTMTIDCDNEYFRIGKGTIWEGKTLYELYGEAYTPWEWHPKLMQTANELGMDLFSTPFDATSVDFLEELNVPAYKIASFELTDIPLIKKVAATGKPVIMSTGMGSREEITDAVKAVRAEGNSQLILLKCTSAYPALPEDADLNTIADMKPRFSCDIGLSDHTIGNEVVMGAVSLGACVIEKHFCMSRNDPGPDSAFSLEPQEFKVMVDAVREGEKNPNDIEVDKKVFGTVSYERSEKEEACIAFRRSLFAVEDIQNGEMLTHKNVRVIRPSNGLPPKHLDDVIGLKAAQSISRGTPLSWDLID